MLLVLCAVLSLALILHQHTGTGGLEERTYFASETTQAQLAGQTFPNFKSQTCFSWGMLYRTGEPAPPGRVRMDGRRRGTTRRQAARRLECFQVNDLLAHQLAVRGLHLARCRAPHGRWCWEPSAATTVNGSSAPCPSSSLQDRT